MLCAMGRPAQAKKSQTYNQEDYCAPPPKQSASMVEDDVRLDGYECKILYKFHPFSIN